MGESLTSAADSRKQKRVPGIGRIFKPRWRRAGEWQESPHWWVGYYHRGKEYRENSSAENEAAALKFLKERVKALGRGQVKPQEERVTFEAIAADFIKDYEVNAKRSLRAAKLSKHHLTDFFGPDRALDITTERARQYIAKRQGEKASNASINRELAALKRMFSLSVQGGALSSKPYIPRLEENNARQGFLDHAAFMALRENLVDYLKDPVTFLYFSGWRVSEMRSLEWRDVDLTGKIIRLRAEFSKNKEARPLPLTGELLDVLNRAKSNRRLDCPFVFHHKGKAVGDFRKAWRNAYKAATLGKVLVHDLRRTAVRNLVRAGVPERVAMSLSGHKTRSVFDRYNIVSESDLAQATERLQSHLEKQPKSNVKELKEAS
jgi:integrase